MGDGGLFLKSRCFNSTDDQKKQDFRQKEKKNPKPQNPRHFQLKLFRKNKYDMKRLKDGQDGRVEGL